MIIVWDNGESYESHDIDFYEALPGYTLKQMTALLRLRDRSGFVGTADELADLFEELGEQADNDGFLLWGDIHPVTVHRLLDDLVPILRRRGILRTEYGTGGLLSNLKDF